LTSSVMGSTLTATQSSLAGSSSSTASFGDNEPLIARLLSAKASDVGVSLMPASDHFSATAPQKSRKRARTPSQKARRKQAAAAALVPPASDSSSVAGVRSAAVGDSVKHLTAQAEMRALLSKLEIDPAFADSFAREDVRVDDLPYLPEADLIRLIPQAGPRSRLLRHLRTTAPSAVVPVAAPNVTVPAVIPSVASTSLIPTMPVMTALAANIPITAIESSVTPARVLVSAATAPSLAVSSSSSSAAAIASAASAAAAPANANAGAGSTAAAGVPNAVSITTVDSQHRKRPRADTDLTHDVSDHAVPTTSSVSVTRFEPSTTSVAAPAPTLTASVPARAVSAHSVAADSSVRAESKNPSNARTKRMRVASDPKALHRLAQCPEFSAHAIAVLMDAVVDMQERSETQRQRRREPSQPARVTPALGPVTNANGARRAPVASSYAGVESVRDAISHISESKSSAVPSSLSSPPPLERVHRSGILEPVTSVEADRGRGGWFQLIADYSGDY